MVNNCRALIIILLVVVVSSFSVVFGGEFIEYNYDGRDNFLWVPTVASATNKDTSDTNVYPLFVMLHGCSQNASLFAVGTQMNAHCDVHNCFVLYPDQPSSANAKKCWNWFNPKDQQRGTGEPLLIVNMAKSLFDSYKIDPERVFLGGMSAGGAMAVVMGATYPDFFRAIAVGSGSEYKAALTAAEGLEVQKKGGPDPHLQGLLAYKAALGNNRKIVVLLTHGTADTIVYDLNSNQVVDQYVTTLDLVLGNGQSFGYLSNVTHHITHINATAPYHSYTISKYRDRLRGDILITYILVNGMNHAWSGGSADGTYTDPYGPDASEYMIKYFYEWAPPHFV